MSYIHEALKKAQVERDLGKSTYGGIPVPRRKKSFFTARKAIFAAALLVLVLLAFAGYSWWDQRAEDKGLKIEDRGQKAEDRGMSSVVRRPSSESKPSSVLRPPSSEKRKTEKSRENVAETYQRARALHRDGRMTDAGLWYEKVLSMDPGHVEALNNRGVLHLHEKSYSAARKCFEKAIRLKPDYVDPYYNLACVCAAQGQLQLGLRYLGKAVSMDPNVKKWAKEDPDLDPLRALPRFKEMVEKGE